MFLINNINIYNYIFLFILHINCFALSTKTSMRQSIFTEKKNKSGETNGE